MKLFIKILMLIFLVSCGYTPIMKTKDLNFSITNIEGEGINNINYKIKNTLKRFSNVENKSIFYEAKIFSKKEKTTLSKDSKGNPKIFQIEIIVKLKIFENNDLKEEKIFVENFKYKNSSEKFELSQYEKNLEENLTNKILQKINLFLYSL